MPTGQPARMGPQGSARTDRPAGVSLQGSAAGDWPAEIGRGRHNHMELSIVDPAGLAGVQIDHSQ